jgi:germination protein M
MRHKKKLLAGVLVLSLAGTAGCGLFSKTTSQVDPPPSGANQTGDKVGETFPITLYFADEKGFVVPLKVNIPKVEGIATQALEYLKPEKANSFLKDTGLHSVIPDGTKMTVKIDKELATVDFSGEIRKIKVAQEEQRLVDAVVWTLTEFTNVKQVQITVNGNIVPAMPLSGTPIGKPLSRENGINLQVAPNINPAETTKVTLYYQGSNQAGNFSYLVPVTRLIGKTGDDLVKTTIAQLVAGPMSKGLSPTLSAATKLLNGTMSGDTVTLDFDENLMKEGATTEQQKLFNSIVLSVLESTHAQKVKITVKGQPPAAAPGMDFSKPISRPQFVNQKQL